MNDPANTIITRFPPSPTGHLHVGGARTALFNWLYARHTKGRFVLRIEDTDRERSTDESVRSILEALDWIGIDWDEGPHFQSQRMPIYQEHIQQLIKDGHAYYCTCTTEEVEQMREAAKAAGANPKYNGACRRKNLPPTDGAVVRFKAPETGTTILDDRVKGAIAFQNTELDDFVIARADGSPTYNFVVVVDDMTMGINTIIRGDDHVMNTPKQIRLYQALGASLPAFAHVPMVLGKDKSRLSKRHGAMSITAYRDMGYLPEAMINYLVRLGWSHGDQEFFTVTDLVEAFDLPAIGKSAGVFDPDKLLALNADHIQACPTTDLVNRLKPFMNAAAVPIPDDALLERAVDTLKPRSKTLVDMAEDARFYFVDAIEFDPAAAKKFLKANALEPITLLMAEIESLTETTEKALEAAFAVVMEKTGFKLGKIAQPVRVALTGRTASPGIFEVMAILGPEKALNRLAAAVTFIENRIAAQG